MDEERKDWMNRSMRVIQCRAKERCHCRYVVISHTHIHTHTHTHTHTCAQPVSCFMSCVRMCTAPEETGRFMAKYLLSATRYGWIIVNLFTSRPKVAITLNSFTLVQSGCDCRACCRPSNAPRNLHNTGSSHTSPDQCRPDHSLT